MPRPKASRISCPPIAGRAMQAELEALGKALDTPKRPLVAIVGGAKVPASSISSAISSPRSTRWSSAAAWPTRFSTRRACAVGKSLCEKDLAETARAIIAKAQETRCAILLPVDAIVAFEFAANAPAHAVGVDAMSRRRHDPRHRPALDRPHQGGDQRSRDRGLERAARRFRTRRLRTRHMSARAACRRTHQGGQAGLGRRRRRHGRGAQRRRRRATISPMSRRRAAPSSNGWKARRCRASRRCGAERSRLRCGLRCLRDGLRRLRYGLRRRKRGGIRRFDPRVARRLAEVGVGRR